ncbi:hypothetical protein [Streptomyces sp. NRRL F-5755]|uniref:hypothetical protein n=1 Tax=Streptomyces sp. NRRL F-5755 TaxID=1519475 RepID=UPI001F2997F5|nr:hypothetical protein [Streptomyces sp. NRRL F-5755]
MKLTDLGPLMARRQEGGLASTASAWQPQVRAHAREQASDSGGMMVHVVACFGFTASGASDDGCERHITTQISPIYAAQTLQLQEAGATEDIAVAAGLLDRGAAASSRVVASSEDEMSAELPDRVG